MTLKDFEQQYGLGEYTASVGDTLKTMISVVYENYSDRLFDLVVLFNGSFTEWDCIEEGTVLKFPYPEDISKISEIL